MNHSDPDPTEEYMNRRFQEEYISRRLYERYQVWNYWIEHSVKYLLFMNAGGIIAVLTFMGILNIVRAVSWAGLSLLSFVIGVILVGLLFSHMYEFFKKNCKGLEEDREDFLSHKISWEDLLAKDAPRLQESKCAERLARISSICILGGIVFGFIGFFTYAC